MAGVMACALVGGHTEGQAVPPDGPEAIVRAQKKPGGEWKEYPSRTLQSLDRFDAELVDSGLSPFGGTLLKRGSATGFFHTEQIGDRWWIVDPAGYLYYNKAVVSVTVGKSPTSVRLVDSLFGSEEAWAESTVHMLHANGFNGTGAWSSDVIVRKDGQRLPYTLMWNFMSSYGKRRGGTYQQPGHTGYPDDCIFVFDPEFAGFCEERAAQLAATKDDPYLLGHFSDNEMPFPEDALDRYLRIGGSDPGFLAAREWLSTRKGQNASTTAITDEDRAAFLELVADRYFSVTAAAIRKADPNHLLLGSRLHGGALNRKPVFAGAGRHIDVIAVNYYNTWTPNAEKMDNWARWSGKPVLITEWYVKGADAGLPNTSGAGWIVPTQSDRGIFYQHFALTLLESRNCVGWQWFKYIDNDPNATGVDPSNNDANKGIVSIRFEPYVPLLEKMRELNRRVYRLIDYFDARVVR